jgi:UDP-N-acetylglucosamine acyltransferase
MNNISPLAYIHPIAKIGDGNVIGPFCVIDADVEIGDNNNLVSHVILHEGCRMGSNNEVYPGASLSTKPQDLKFHGEKTFCIIGDNNSIRENVTLSRGTASKGKTVIGNGNLLMEDVHIAHDCVVGNSCIIGNSTKIAGEIHIDDFAILSACVLAHQFINIGSYVMIQGSAKLPMDVPPFIMVGKEPTRYCGLNLVGLRRHNFSNERIDRIHEAYRLLYSKGLRSEAIEQIKKMGEDKDLDYIVRFVENSQRGILRG